MLYEENKANSFLQNYGYSASLEEGIYLTGGKIAQPEPVVNSYSVEKSK